MEISSARIGLLDQGVMVQEQIDLAGCKLVVEFGTGVRGQYGNVLIFHGDISEMRC